MVFYRKYRPQNISDLDSQDVRQKLHSVLLSASPTFIGVPHAFLFTGPKGLGKTSTARIVAKVINCTGRVKIKGADPIEPCNACEQCTTITSGTNLDILEIDAASNRGIDEIRDLKEKIRLSPVAANKKIYIIDEVHMLTNEAFNALLKTLEEPPSHAVFILCTTESHKIPATILSRCFHLPFKRATEDELVRAFKRIIKAEKLDVSDQVLKDIAKLADGGFRDGTKILEELVSLSDGKEIKSELFEKIYQVSSVDQSINELLVHCEAKDLKAALAVVATVVQQGNDMMYFQSEFLQTLHELLLQKVGIPSEESTSSELSLTDLRSLLELVSKAGAQSKSAVITSLPLELALVSWCEGTGELRIKNEELRIKEVVSVVKNEEVTVASLRKQVGNMVKQQAVLGPTKPPVSTTSKKEPSDVSILKFSGSGEHSQEWIDSLWKNIIVEMKNHNHMIAGVLRSCRPASYDRSTLVIVAGSQFHLERLQETKAFDALLAVCKDLIGNAIKVKIELKSS